ncbi:short tail fiber protein [Aeromonas phage B614]|nr:short tail fiber protein [Aeromonas phage B614]UYD58250.1 short tail fiber protein [Aeromonas phage UP87]UYD58364.1 short tail fiber protein [Aeromonas phage avDM14-QBC]UYD58828.1 short tail fiber protein [Aeromonas phage avDM10-HWA]UYD58869.1 short tail fiber protein [Aeromonas phage avDM7-IJDJ]UYD59929.1 short tail fiber protein [Aeromonas phage avDM9-HANS]
MVENNIKLHISDSADSVLFSGAGWPAAVKTVGDALNRIGPWAITDNGLPLATTENAGVIRIATQSEMTVGTSTNTAITPALLKLAMQTPQATDTVVGNTRYATNAEALALAMNSAAITPAKLGHVFANKGATETARGTMRISTVAQARSGTDDTTSMTPLKTKLAIEALSQAWGPATEAARGVVQMSTVAQALQGTLRDGFAISPYTLSKMAGTENAAGMFKVATDSQALALVDNTVAMTPYKVGRLVASPTQRGLVQITAGPNFQPGVALAASSPVLYTTGGTMTGNITFNQNWQGVMWSRNTDYAHIIFKNDSNADTDSFLEFKVSDDHNEYFRWNISENIAGTLRNGGHMWLAGNIDVNDFYIRSDKRLKHGFKPIENALDKLDFLHPGTYHKQYSLDNDDIVGVEAGMYAQDFQKAMPEGVKSLSDGTLTISPSAQTAFLTQVVKELKEQVIDLQNSIAKLKGEKND